MKRCAQCGTMIVAGGVERAGRAFCSAKCAAQSQMPRNFCPDCLAKTTNESTGNLGRLNGFGVTIMRVNSVPPCPTCNAVTSRKWITLLFIPVIPLATYRVIYMVKGNGVIGRSRFFARKLRPQNPMPAQQKA